MKSGERASERAPMMAAGGGSASCGAGAGARQCSLRGFHNHRWQKGFLALSSLPRTVVMFSFMSMTLAAI